MILLHFLRKYFEKIRLVFIFVKVQSCGSKYYLVRAVLIFEKKTDVGLSWGITFYSGAPTLIIGQVEKKGKEETFHDVF
jgi:hypothetical protein